MDVVTVAAPGVRSTQSLGQRPRGGDFGTSDSAPGPARRPASAGVWAPLGGGGGVRRKVWSPQSTDVAQLRIFSQLLPVTVAGRGGVYILRASVNTRAERCGLLDFEIFWFCVCSGV